MKWLITLLVIQTIRNTLECWYPPGDDWGPPGGAGGANETDPNNQTTANSTKKKSGAGGDPYEWGGFEPPPGVEDWNSWLERYNQSLLDKAIASGDLEKDRPSDAAADWPEDWINLGVGVGGVEPPPWAYIPKNTGKPLFCLAPSETGNCTDGKGVVESRWAFNPYIDDCAEFKYSGCYGNQNNFRTKLKCQQSCLTSRDEGCDSDSHIKIGELRRSCGLSDQELLDKADVMNEKGFIE